VRDLPVFEHRKALRSGITPLRLFAKRLRPYMAGIVAHARYPLGTNLIEGINNKIRTKKKPPGLGGS
jgi:transposase